MKLRLFIYFIFFSVFFSCSTAKKENLKTNLYEILYQGNDGSALKSYRLLKNFEDYKAVYMPLKQKNIPYIDFEKSNVLVINLGKKKGFGFSVLPEKIIEDKNNIIIILKETYTSQIERNKIIYSNPITIIKINSKKEVILK